MLTSGLYLYMCMPVHVHIQEHEHMQNFPLSTIHRMQVKQLQGISSVQCCNSDFDLPFLEVTFRFSVSPCPLSIFLFPFLINWSLATQVSSGYGIKPTVSGARSVKQALVIVIICLQQLQISPKRFSVLSAGKNYKLYLIQISYVVSTHVREYTFMDVCMCVEAKGCLYPQFSILYVFKILSPHLTF